MRVSVSVSILAWLLATGSAYAAPDQIRTGPAPAWATTSELLPVPENPSGALFIRRQDVIAHLSAEGAAQHTSYRTRILQSSALPLGNISIAWSSVAPAPIVHGVKVHRDGQVIDALKDASFEVIRRENQLEAATLDGMLTAVLRVSDLRVGDELEVAFTTFANDPTLGPNSAGLLMMMPAPAPGRYHLGLSWDDGQKPTVRMADEMTKAAVFTERAIDLRFDNPPVATPPNDAPPRYRWPRALEFTDFANWATISRHFAPLYAKAAALPDKSPLKREAERIAATQTTLLARAGAALKLVQQDVRYIYVGLNGGNLTPATAEETWRRRYGDCKGKTALLLALLAELGIAAEPVLVNSNGIDDGLDQRLPMPQYFDHVLVRARIDGATYWLDGTLPAVATPSLEPVLPLKWVLPLTAQGSDLQRLDWRPATTPEEVALTEIDARAGFDKPARKVQTIIVRGAKALQQQVVFSAIPAAQIKEGFRQRMVGNAWETIDDVQWRYDQKTGASVLTISGTGMIDWEDEGGGAKSLSLPGGGFSPPQRRLRATAETRDVPFYTTPEYSCHATTVRLPTSTQPAQWSAVDSFTTRIFGRTYYRAWQLRDGAIRMVRGYRIEQPEIDVASAERDNARIPAFDNSMGVIYYRPTRPARAIGDGTQVPATYDIDWTSGDVPCQPAVKTAVSRSLG